MSILFYFNTNFLYHNVHVPFVSTNFNFYQSFFSIYTTVLHYRPTDKTILILISISKPLLCIFFDFSREATSHSFSEKDRRTRELLSLKQQPAKGLNWVCCLYFAQSLFVTRKTSDSLILVRKHISFVL